MTEPALRTSTPDAVDDDAWGTLHARIYAAAVGSIYLGTLFVLWLPAMFLATGVQAIGRELGWWAGDYMANDGEETFSTAIGLIGTFVVLMIAAALTCLAASLVDRRMRGAVQSVLIGSFVVVLLQGIFWTALLMA